MINQWCSNKLNSENVKLCSVIFNNKNNYLCVIFNSRNTFYERKASVLKCSSNLRCTCNYKVF